MARQVHSALPLKHSSSYQGRPMVASACCRFDFETQVLERSNQAESSCGVFSCVEKFIYSHPWYSINQLPAEPE
jgi:hypothetical protein